MCSICTACRFFNKHYMHKVVLVRSVRHYPPFPYCLTPLHFLFSTAYCHGKDMLSTLCSLITGDALLYSMFRENAKPVPCPFKGPFTFTYSRGHGECSSPVSSIDTCTDDSRLLLSYQACPDIHGTESAGEKIESGTVSSNQTDCTLFFKPIGEIYAMLSMKFYTECSEKYKT